MSCLAQCPGLLGRRGGHIIFFQRASAAGSTCHKPNDVSGEIPPELDAAKEDDGPLADDDEVVLDALVVDEFALLEEGHLDLCVADALGDGGHASCATERTDSRAGCDRG